MRLPMRLIPFCTVDQEADEVNRIAEDGCPTLRRNRCIDKIAINPDPCCGNRIDR